MEYDSLTDNYVNLKYGVSYPKEKIMESLRCIRELDHVQFFRSKFLLCDNLLDDAHAITNPSEYLAYHIGAFTNCFKPDEMLCILLRFAEKCGRDVSGVVNEYYSLTVALHTIYSNDIKDSIRKLLTLGITIPDSFIYNASSHFWKREDVCNNAMEIVRVMIEYQNFNPCAFITDDSTILRHATQMYAQNITLFDKLYHHMNL